MTDNEEEEFQHDSPRRESKPLLDDLTNSSKFQYFGYIIVLVQAISYAISIVSTQVSVLDLNILQYNMIRYLIQALVAFGIMHFRRESVKILKDDMSYFITIGLLDMTGTVCIFATATFLPIGNLDAFYNAVLIVIASCYKIMKRQISYLGVVTYLILVVGIVLLTQPWNSQVHRNVINMSPCRYINYNENMSGLMNYANASSNTTVTMVTDAVDDIFPDGWLTKHSQLLGYAVLIIAALEYTGHGVLSRSLLKNYKVPVVIFWVSLLELILSFIISLVWQSLRREAFFMVPAGSYCVLFMCMYIIFMTLSNFVIYYVHGYFKSYPYSVACLPTIVLLYLIQRTALKWFQPGNANLVEIVGVVLILFGIVGLPLLAKLVKSNKSETGES